MSVQLVNNNCELLGESGHLAKYSEVDCEQRIVYSAYVSSSSESEDSPFLKGLLSQYSLQSTVLENVT